MNLIFHCLIVNILLITIHLKCIDVRNICITSFFIAMKFKCLLQALPPSPLFILCRNTTHWMQRLPTAHRVYIIFSFKIFCTKTFPNTITIHSISFEHCVFVCMAFVRKQTDSMSQPFIEISLFLLRLYIRTYIFNVFWTLANWIHSNNAIH